MKFETGVLLFVAVLVISIVAFVSRVITKLRKGDYDNPPHITPADKPSIDPVDQYLASRSGLNSNEYDD